MEAFGLSQQSPRCSPMSHCTGVHHMKLWIECFLKLFYDNFLQFGSSNANVLGASFRTVMVRVNQGMVGHRND